MARKNNTERENLHHTYHNCKIINIVTPSKSVPRDVIELHSSSSDDLSEHVKKNNDMGSDNSESQFEKALGELDVDEIAANYWRKKKQRR